MNVRPADVADAAGIADLSTTLGYPANPSAMRERLERLLARPDCAIFVGDVNGTVVGWIHVAVEDLLVAGERCEIWGLVVDGAHRRVGVGRRLVEAAERWAFARGLDLISVRSNIVRNESHPFYARLGYARAKTQHAYRKSLRGESV